jgi:hypothetical protein
VNFADTRLPRHAKDHFDQSGHQPSQLWALVKRLTIDGVNGAVSGIDSRNTTKGSSSTAEQIEAADVMDKIYANHRVARIVIKFKG